MKANKNQSIVSSPLQLKLKH